MKTFAHGQSAYEENDFARLPWNPMQFWLQTFVGQLVAVGLLVGKQRFQFASIQPLTQVLFLLVAFAASSVCAGGLIFALRTTAGNADAVKIRDKYQALWGGAPITRSMLPIWEAVANTNIQYYILCAETNRPGCPMGPLETMTKAQFDTWKNANLDTPSDLQARRFEGKRNVEVLYAAGLTNRPGKGP